MRKVILASLAATIVTLTSGIVLASHGSTAADRRQANAYAREQCFGGEWEGAGFKNQGQCMRFYTQPDTYDADRYN
jgi:hypothetical protein